MMTTVRMGPLNTQIVYGKGSSCVQVLIHLPMHQNGGITCIVFSKMTKIHDIVKVCRSMEGTLHYMYIMSITFSVKPQLYGLAPVLQCLLLCEYVNRISVS